MLYICQTKLKHMELIIHQEGKFKVRVNIEDRDFKKGDIICGYVCEFPNFKDRNRPPLIPAHWWLYEIKSDRLANFYRLVDKHYKVVEIYGK